MAYKFQIGDARLSGSLTREGTVHFKDAAGNLINVTADKDGDVDIVQHNGTSKGLKLGGTRVTSTAAELNLMDGGTARGTTAVADGDGIVTNDGGTMRQTNVTTFQTYFDANSVGGGNIVTVGALNAGSITSGFGAIDNGGSAITTTGLGTFGSLDVDDVVINGTTIGHTDDTDLLTLADGVLTVAGEVSMTTLDIGGTNVSATAAELNLIDGGTARGTDAVASGDGLLVNDNGTMKMTNVDTVSTYFAAHSVGGTNMVTVGALNAGSITSGFGNIDNGSSTITTTGLGTFGSLDVDDVLINGSTIGHTDDTDLLTLANGALTVAGTITTGVDDAGFDVKFFGDTASAYMLWDTSADDLILAGAAGLVVPENQFSLGNTAVTSTAAELNLVDGSSAGTAVASKAAIYNTTKGLNAVQITSSWYSGGKFTSEVDLNANNLIGIGDLDVAGNATFLGNVDLGNASGDTISFAGSVDTHILPTGNRNLGAANAKWDKIYANEIVGADTALDIESYGAAPLGYTVSGTCDFALLEASSQTYTLPTAVAGKQLHVKLSGSIHTCTIAAAGNDWVEGSANILLESTGSAITLIAEDATHWHII